MALTLGHQLINYGEEHLGTPYEFGGDGPETFDCSGFVRYVIQYVTGEGFREQLRASLKREHR